MMNLRPLLTLIGSVEAPRGYDQVFGGSKIQPPSPITGMSIRALREWQDASVKAGSVSSAAGRYQIIRKTVDSLLEQGVVKPYDRFDEPTQDRMAVALLKRRGLDSWAAKRISDAQFADNLAREWASLPLANGTSFYAGDGLNKALVSRERVLRALQTVLAYSPPWYVRVLSWVAGLWK